MSLGGGESAENSNEGRGFSAAEEAAVAIALDLRERLEMTFPSFQTFWFSLVKISIAHLFGVAMLTYIMPLPMQLESRVWQLARLANVN